MSNLSFPADGETRDAKPGVVGTIEPRPTLCGLAADAGSSGRPKRKGFQELFSRDELCYYGLAALIYIVAGVLLENIVLNWIVGPLFIVIWMWRVPMFVESWGER